jgi:RNA polymerase sigma-70 factor (ECF subfamily)
MDVILKNEENILNSRAEIKKLSDNDIINLVVKEGKRNLYAILVDRYRTKIIDKSYSLLKDRSLAREFANDILSKAYENLTKFEGTSSFSTWLFSITYNYCIDYLRSKKKMHYPRWNSKNEMPEIVDVEEEDLAELNYNHLITLMEMIHPEEKAILIMKYQDDLPLRQIAAALRISESALKMRLQRAKARILFLHKKYFKN